MRLGDKRKEKDESINLSFSSADHEIIEIAPKSLAATDVSSSTTTTTTVGMIVGRRRLGGDWGCRDGILFYPGNEPLARVDGTGRPDLNRTFPPNVAIRLASSAPADRSIRNGRESPPLS